MNPKLPQNVSDVERQLIKDHLVIPVMLDYIASDISVIQKSGLRTDLLLVNALVKVQDDILTEHLGIRLNLKKAGIKVYNVTLSENGLYANYLCRGYEHTIEMLLGLVRTEVLEKASRYTGIRLTTG